MFVATQGPNDRLTKDFWWMIWQLCTSKIVMLTNCIEEERVHCVQYWPEYGFEAKVYGNVAVECTTVEVMAHYTIRTLRLCNVKQDRPRSSTGRIVKHFQFTSWSSDGLPVNAPSLVDFYNCVMSTPTHGQGPMVVHCSNGVGRTGMFLALVNLIEQAMEAGTVDPYNCVERMRHERVDMVQTEDQYEFLHFALSEAIIGRSGTVLATEFRSCYDSLLEINPETGEARIKEKFETLNLMTPPYKLEEYQTALSPENLAKNRFEDILASDNHRPYLTTTLFGRTDYINAVYLPTHEKKRAFILTQMPMQDTVIDFWRMMFDSYSQTVIMLNDDHDDQLTMGVYWPRNSHGREMYGPYFVEVETREDYEGYRVLTLNVTDNSSNTGSVSDNVEQRTIQLFQCHFWREEQVTPDSPNQLLQVMAAVDVWKQQTDQTPVTVHCLDGVERSGLFCVLSAILERLRIEQDVSILQTINQMRVCRPQLVQSFDQFTFLHTAVLVYLEDFSTYTTLL